MNSAEFEQKKLTFQVCVAAVFADKSVSLDENHFLSHLIEQLGSSEDEREELRTLRAKETVLNDLAERLAKLSKEQSEQLFSTAVEILHSDRKVNKPEKGFLKQLRKLCGVAPQRAYSLARAAGVPYKRELNNWMKAAIAIAFLTVLSFVGNVVRTIIFALAFSGSTKPESPVMSGVSGVSCSNLPISFQVITPDSAQKHESSSDIYEAVQRNIVRVNILKNGKIRSFGSGTVIGQDSTGDYYVLTNRHVIDDVIDNGNEFRIEVKQYEGARFGATLDFYSKEHDLAFLRVRYLSNYTSIVKLALKENLRVGQNVYALGNPAGLENTFTKGVISAFRENDIQTDAVVFGGSSGGPLIEEHGALCGIVTRGFKAKDFNFAQYADLVFTVHEERMNMIEKKDK